MFPLFIHLYVKAAICIHLPERYVGRHWANLEQQKENTFIWHLITIICLIKWEFAIWILHERLHLWENVKCVHAIIACERRWWTRRSTPALLGIHNKTRRAIRGAAVTYMIGKTNDRRDIWGTIITPPACTWHFLCDKMNAAKKEWGYWIVARYIWKRSFMIFVPKNFSISISFSTFMAPKQPFTYNEFAIFHWLMP